MPTQVSSTPTPSKSRHSFDCSVVTVHVTRDGGQTHSVIVTTDDVISEKEDAVKGFVRALARAEQLLADDPDGRELLGTCQEVLDDETLDKEHESLSAVLPTTPEIDQAHAESVGDDPGAAMTRNLLRSVVTKGVGPASADTRRG